MLGNLAFGHDLVLGVIRKVIFTGGIRVAAACVSLLFTVAVTRNLTSDQAGLFFIAFSLLAVLSVFFKLGLDSVLLRRFGEQGFSGTGQFDLYSGLRWVAVSSSIFAFSVFMFSDFISVSIFSKKELSPVLKAAVVALPLMSVSAVFASALMGLQRPLWGVFLQSLALPLFSLVLCLSLDFFELDATAFSSIYSFSAMLVCIVAACIWFQQEGVSFERKGGWKNTTLWKSSSNLWVASIMSLAVNWSGVLVAGAFVDSTELAYFSAAQRTALLINFVLIVVNVVVGPQYARLSSEGNVDSLKRLAKWATRGMIILGVPLVILIVFLPDAIMSIFGAGFEGGSEYLQIMAAGQFFGLMVGSASYLLQMSGFERDFRKVTMISGMTCIALSLLFTFLGGAAGAAYATTIGLIVHYFGLFIMVRKRLGFWTV
ncbi:MAG: oligosaccharide flippase family protein [Cellvibrionaceae bacterium]